MAVNLEDGTSLDHIRDYVGTEAPSDSDLAILAESATYWQEVALRVLRRRRASAASGGEPSFALTGVLSVGASKGDIPTLDSAIADLENQLAALTGQPATAAPMVSRIVRPYTAR